MKKIPAYTDLDNFDFFVFLVESAKERQGNQITQDQYDLILSKYLSSQEIRYPIFGWFYSSRAHLDQKLRSLDIVVRKNINSNIWAYRNGFIGIVDAEEAIIKSKGESR